MQGKIALPGIAICIKLQCNLYQMSFSFHSNGIVISVMLRAKVTGITTQEERSEDTEAVKWVRIHAKSTF